eukprot:CAMPEP_0175198142 /NCGR_PEP_ID=MMETSP0093-20121207/8376_1 /TAXON_ID=311494 /ORGANISM="Alexandrium monilatum, Strain CCMP3105" /LENGTH=83 /DNA_ID=CAMNT_0016491129 /DNA_START=68 /DNA_END=315 /DNA_ORIENTATION=-
MRERLVIAVLLCPVWSLGTLQVGHLHPEDAEANARDDHVRSRCHHQHLLRGKLPDLRNSCILALLPSRALRARDTRVALIALL